MTRISFIVLALLCAIVLCAVGTAVGKGGGADAGREMDDSPLLADDGEMLLDYYVGTTPAREAVGMTETYELVLSRMPDGSGQIDEYERSSRSDPEVRRSWRVPISAWDEAREIIASHGMEGWNDRTFPPGAVGGPIYVCRFKRGDGFVRVTSEHMPRGGITAFFEIAGLLTRCIKSGEEIEQ